MMKKPNQPNLTDEERNQVISDLLDRSDVVDGKRKLARGALKTASQKFRRSERCLRDVWKRALKNRETLGTYHSVSLIASNSGRPVLYDREVLLDELESLPHHQRRTQRDVAERLGVSRWVVNDMLKNDKVILPHTNSIKPMLREEDKVMRMLHSADRVKDGYFVPSEDEIHVDEKWFFISEINQRTYITEREKRTKKLPHRKCGHKSHIMKAMFLAAAARPQFNTEGECAFDGKIGMCPFIERVQAKIKSKNRPAGTWEIEPVSVDKDRYRACLLDKVVPDAIRKWPRDRSVRIQHIGIQQDNPPSHISPRDKEWNENKDKHARFKFHLREQPARSPDTNVPDLGFFRATQSIQWKLPPATTIEGLIANVKAAWEQHDPLKLNRIWTTHQQVCDCIMTHQGDNHYEMPHMGKEALERQNNLPSRLKLSEGAAQAMSQLERV